MVKQFLPVPVQPQTKRPRPLIVPDGLRADAARLLRYFRTLSPKNQSLAIRLLRALWKTQGPNTSA